MDGPVKWQAPDTRAPVIDVKTGCWTPNGHRWALSAFFRTGGYNDAVFQALGIGQTGLGGVNRVQQQVDDLGAGLAAVQGAVAGLRGDPRLEAAVRALQVAVSALGLVQARASGEYDRRLGELGALVDSLGGRATKTTQTLALLQEGSRQEGVGLQMFQTAQTQRAASDQMQLADELNQIVDEFNVRVRQALSATGSLSYDDATGIFSFTDAVTEVAGKTGAVALDTDDVSEAGNLYHTAARARDAVESFIQPAASISPTNNGDLVIEATADTTLTLKFKGSDGTVRSVALTLAP